MSDIVIVGAGFCGCTAAERLASAGRKVLVLEKRNHIGGNCYSEVDPVTGVECHKYGSHIFHTNNEQVWHYLNQFVVFNQYRHTVWTTYKNRVYSMPINLATINAYYNMNLKPWEVSGFLDGERQKENYENPENLEEKAVSLVGRPLYEAFIKGYTIKQWDADPKTLCPDIITRLPVRSNYNNRYFRDPYEGIPVCGYTGTFERLLDHPNITVELSADYFAMKQRFSAAPTLYTGPIDRFFNYEYGHLDWRTIDFELERHDMSDYQGCTVMNYADSEVPYTRIHEFKHFHPEREDTERTITYREYSRIAGRVDEPYYPVNTPRNRELLSRYQQLMADVPHILFSGRLGSYRYLDMDATIACGLNVAEKMIKTEV